MDLETFLKSERGTAAKLARDIGVKQVIVSRWLAKTRPIPAERCPAIQKATNGLVTCAELRPDIEWSVLQKKPRVPA